MDLCDIGVGPAAVLAHLPLAIARKLIQVLSTSRFKGPRRASMDLDASVFGIRTAW